MSGYDKARQIVEEAEKLTAEWAEKRNLVQPGKLAWEYGFFKGVIAMKLADALDRIEELEPEHRNYSRTTRRTEYAPMYFNGSDFYVSQTRFVDKASAEGYALNLRRDGYMGIATIIYEIEEE